MNTTILLVANLFSFGFLFTIWKASDTLNITLKMFMLAMVVANALVLFKVI